VLFEIHVLFVASCLRAPRPFFTDRYRKQYYHSIHARGEDVEEVLRRAEMGEIAGATATTAGLSGDWHDVNINAAPELPATAGAGVGAEDVEDGEIEDDDGEVDEALTAAKAALSQQGKPRTHPACP
jgi:hypothetical protein